MTHLSAPDLPLELTEDAFLGGKVSAFQPKKGFRAAIDTVCLAAAVSAKPGERIADIGAGAGIVSLCLLARISDVAVTAIEASSQMAALARQNFQHNQLKAEVWTADLYSLEVETPFDQIVTNPPYGLEGTGTPSPFAAKEPALRSTGGLEVWLAACGKMLARKGRLTLVCRADQADVAIRSLSVWGGDIRLFPLWPRQGEKAKRVILSARKGVHSPMQVLPGLALHGVTQRYSPEAEAVLRDGAPIDLAP